MASILTIPLELLVSISSYLPTSDLAALRQTCKLVETSLYEWFSEEFFTKKQFMLTQPSLQALIDISKHASLSKKLKHVIIATNMYENRSQHFQDRDNALCYFQGLEEQRILLSSGFGRDMLTEAFQNLPKLDTIGIRNFNARNRVRDNGSWSSWGATTVFKETGVNLQMKDLSASRSSASADTIDFVSRVFSTVFHALGRANCMPSQFEVLLHHRGLPDTTLNIPDFLLPSVKHVMQNMSSLLLTVEFLARHNGFVMEVAPGNALRRFLSYAPNLAHLRLNFLSSTVLDIETTILDIESFLEWLGQTPTSSGQQIKSFFEVLPVNFHSLKRLDLGQVNTQHPDLLISIITKFAPSLVGLNLWKISLLRARIQADERPNLWKEFLTRLSRVPQLNLTNLKLGMLRQDDLYVQFKEGDDENAITREYSGQYMDKFIKEWIEQVMVCWPKTIDRPDPSTDEDEDEEIEDEEEDEEDEDDEEGD